MTLEDLLRFWPPSGPDNPETLPHPPFLDTFTLASAALLPHYTPHPVIFIPT